MGNVLVFSPRSKSLRIPFAAKIASLSVALLLTGGPSVVAQSDDIMRFFRWDQDRMRQQQRKPSPGPVFLRVPRPDSKAAIRRPKPRVSAPTVVVRDTPTPESPKVAPTHHVAVIGDSLGELLGQGLAMELAKEPHIALLKKAKGSSGLVRSDFHDWPKAVVEMLAGSEPISVAVILIGSNDKQPLREGTVSHEPGSDRWRELYRERVRSIVAAFAEKRIPLIWVSLPPMQNARYGADMLVLNEIYRAEVQRGGGHWVELWEAFLDAQGKFATHGPDVAGQPVRLRTTDGIHFTKAGAQKAAHFVDVVLKRLIEQPTTAPLIAVPTEQGSPQVAAVPPPIAFPEPPEPAAAPILPPKPLAGPIQPLAQHDISPGAVLLAEPRRPQPNPGDIARQILVEGIPVPSRPGRADDFRWPAR
jgi:hypothetical protein